MPNSIYFNEVENQQKDIQRELDGLKQGKVFEGNQTLNIIKTSEIKNNGIDTTIGGKNIKSLLKGSTYIIQGRNVVFSASSFNSARVNSRLPSDINFPDVFTINTEGTQTTLSQYNDENIIIFASSGRGARTGNVTVKNLTTGFTIIDNQFFSGANIFGTFYYFVGSAGVIEITNTAASGQLPPIIYIRRCKYPITENSQIKAYDANYALAGSQKITLSLIDTFRVG